MSSFEVQGIVSADTGLPVVHCYLMIDDEKTAEFQVPVLEAREIAQSIHEAAANAVYEAALIAWAKDRDPQDGELMGAHLVGAVREFRSDRWGIPNNPEDFKVE